MAKPNATVAHEWYHSAADEGRGSSFFYEGDVIYSFGHHYPIARKVNGDQNLILFQYLNDWGGYTGRHRNHVQHALASGATIFWVEDVEADTPRAHLDNHNNMYDRLREMADRFPRARESKVWIASAIDAQCEQANDYAEQFDVDVPRDLSRKDFLPPEWEEAIAEMEQRAKEKEERDRVRREQQRLLDEVKRAEAIPRWRAGEGATLRTYSYGEPALLRVKDGNVETSQGASVPVKYAPLAWKLIQRCRRTGNEWRRNGEKVRLGIYQLDAVDAEGNIVAGCHRVEYEELRNVARELNLPLAQLQEV